MATLPLHYFQSLPNTYFQDLLQPHHQHQPAYYDSAPLYQPPPENPPLPPPSYNDDPDPITSLNLKVLRRLLPTTHSIVFQAQYAVIYTYSSLSQTWEKSGKEGTLFVLRESPPPGSIENGGKNNHALVVLNRRGMDNFIMRDWDPEVQCEGGHVIVRGRVEGEGVDAGEGGGEGEDLTVWGLWVWEEDELVSTRGKREGLERVLIGCAQEGEEEDEGEGYKEREMEDGVVFEGQSQVGQQQQQQQQQQHWDEQQPQQHQDFAHRTHQQQTNYLQEQHLHRLQQQQQQQQHLVPHHPYHHHNNQSLPHRQPPPPNSQQQHLPPPPSFQHHQQQQQQQQQQQHLFSPNFQHQTPHQHPPFAPPQTYPSPYQPPSSQPQPAAALKSNGPDLMALLKGGGGQADAPDQPAVSFQAGQLGDQALPPANANTNANAGRNLLGEIFKGVGS